MGGDLYGLGCDLDDVLSSKGGLKFLSRFFVVSLALTYGVYGQSVIPTEPLC